MLSKEELLEKEVSELEAIAQSTGAVTHLEMIG